MTHRDGVNVPVESGTFRVAPAFEGISQATRPPNIGPDASEPDLVLAMVQGVEGAWREFERRYVRLVRHCIGSVTRRSPGLTSEDVREIYAIFICSLLVDDKRRLKAFDPELGYPLSRWIGRLAANAAHDYVRRARSGWGTARAGTSGVSLPEQANTEGFSEVEEAACDRPDPFEQAALHERAQLAARTLEGFSEIDRRFAALYFGEGLEPAEIARSLNISLNTVYSKRCKIQSRLEAALASAVRGAAA